MQHSLKDRQVHSVYPTWQSSHGCSPWLFERDVPHQESRKPYEHTTRGIADTNVCFINSHFYKKQKGGRLAWSLAQDEDRVGLCVRQRI